MTEDRQQEFLTALADVLEVPSIDLEADYRETPLWGSLTAFALKVMLQQRFNATLTLKELDACATAGELMKRLETASM